MLKNSMFQESILMDCDHPEDDFSFIKKNHGNEFFFKNSQNEKESLAKSPQKKV